ncbi:manganese efflux pump MntP [Candidatus Bilamarchaeum dharawalense]|uniref:Putative manganese efflux pump MntP n=1 Tax=Candidatus Bilamarchaeum dharawalense TaxID=2885759 RepID=A0A5E4LKI5_9ARCH|nr:manganese efflux pump MntP [Candidatus Bilamarchaeum dharawalense]
MDVFTISLIALGLSADAFAVAVARSLADKKMKFSTSLTIAAYFGIFQGIMPIIGWYLGLTVLVFVSGIDHWIAFLLLLFVGGKMIYESRLLEKKVDRLDQKTLLMLSVATSIDALAIGLSFSLLKVMIIEAAAIIGLITFFVSLAGCYLGKKFGHLLENKVEILGGLILIGIGLKILLEHLGFF